MIAELERLLGPLAQRNGPRLTAIARVRQERNGRFDLRLWTIREEGIQQRSLQNASCELLAKAGAVIAAMAIDPAEVARRTRGSAAAEIAAEAQTVTDAEPPPPLLTKPSPPPPPPPIAKRAPTPRPRGALRASGGIVAGVLPGLAGEVRLASTLLWRRMRFELEGIYGTPRTLHAEGGVAELQFAGAALRAGPVLQAGQFEFPLCVGIELGVVFGTGENTMDVKGKAARLPLAALHLAPSVLFVPHPRVAVGLTVEGGAHLVRPRFDIGGVEIYQVPPVSLQALGGIEFRFP